MKLKHDFHKIASGFGVLFFRLTHFMVVFGIQNCIDWNEKKYPIIIKKIDGIKWNFKNEFR